MTSAFGKVILLGEHAVVYGHPALAGAIDRRVHCSVESVGGGASRLEAPDWQLSATAGEGTVGEALGRLCRGVNLAGPVVVRVRSDLPAAAGLGSSAALSVACARALFEHTGRTGDVEALAGEAERCFHENPSGVDVALAARGGLGIYVRGKGLEPLDAEPLSIVVGLTGRIRNTADMVNRVRDAVDAEPESGHAALGALSDAATRGKAAIESGNLEALGDAMDTAQQHLAGFGLSTPDIDAMVRDAKSRGALGAKLTGAGGGGAVIALCPGRELDIEQGWRDLGFEVFSCHVGVRS